jgi:hypothetical protein
MKGKISNGIIGILTIVLVAGIFYIGYERGQRKELKKALDVLGEKTREEIAIKDEEILKREERILEMEEKLIGVNERLDRLAEEREEGKKREEEWKRRANDALPDTLVKDLRELLGTEEIWVIPDEGILFSMDAFRKVAEVVYDWNDFSLKREPNYIQTIETFKTKVYLLGQSGAMKDAQILDLKDIRASQEEWNRQMQVFIEKNTGGGFWVTVQKVGTGIAIGALGVLILK